MPLHRKRGSMKNLIEEVFNSNSFSRAVIYLTDATTLNIVPENVSVRINENYFVIQESFEGTVDIMDNYSPGSHTKEYFIPYSKIIKIEAV